jgi:hypothetical protein
MSKMIDEEGWEAEFRSKFPDEEDWEVRSRIELRLHQVETFEAALTEFIERESKNWPLRRRPRHEWGRPPPPDAPKHGSWLDMVESELAVLTTRRRRRRIPDKPNSRERSRGLEESLKQAPRQSRLAIHDRKRTCQTEKAVVSPPSPGASNGLCG